MGRRDGVGRDRAVPRGAGDRARARPATCSTCSRSRGRPSAASMTGGPGEVHATQSLEAEPRSAVRLVPAARVLRHDHAPAHARVRHDRGAVRRGRGRVPPPREPAIPDAVMHGRPMTIDDYLASPYPRGPAAALRLVPDLRRRRGVRDDERRAGARPAAAARGRARVSARGSPASGTHWAQQRAFTSTPQVFSAPPRVRDGRARARPTSTCSRSTTRSRS